MGADANIANEIMQKTTDQSRIDNEFNKLIFENIFYKNLEGLKKNSDIVLFNISNWEQNPKQFCLDHYKEVSFYKIILLVNEVSSIFSFKSEYFKDFKIYAPKQREIYKVLSYVK